MVTLAIAILLALALGLSYEGTVKVPGILASCTLASFGRVRLGLYVFRPGRAYVKVRAA